IVTDNKAINLIDPWYARFCVAHFHGVTPVFISHIILHRKDNDVAYYANLDNQSCSIHPRLRENRCPHDLQRNGMGSQKEPEYSAQLRQQEEQGHHKQRSWVQLGMNVVAVIDDHDIDEGSQRKERAKRCRFAKQQKQRSTFSNPNKHVVAVRVSKERPCQTHWRQIPDGFREYIISEVGKLHLKKLLQRKKEKRKRQV